MRLRSEPKSRLRENQNKKNEFFLKIHFLQQQEVWRVGSKILDHGHSRTEKATVFLENNCTFNNTQIRLLNAVLLRSWAQTVHQEDSRKIS